MNSDRAQREQTLADAIQISYTRFERGEEPTAAFLAAHPELKELHDILLRPDTFSLDAELLHIDGADQRDGVAFGGYRVLRRLGGGGMGTVYEAIQETLGRPVALKVMNRALPTAADRERFLREARTMARVDRPGICRIYEVGEHQGRPFLAMERIEGESLRDVLARAPSKGPARLRRLAVWIEQVARSLHEVHEAGVVHRDLKPGNVMISGDRAPVIVDFGLALDAGTQASRLTGTGDVLGTPGYMAPEQIEGDARDADRRVDVYALGVILYEVAVGQHPFDGKTPDRVYRQVLEGCPRPRALDATVPVDLEAVILRAMHLDPAHRYPTARDLADDLGRWLAGERTRARPPSRLADAARWLRRHRWPVAAAGLLASLAIVSGALRSERSRAVDAVANDVSAAMRWIVDVASNREPSASDRAVVDRYLPPERLAPSSVAPDQWPLLEAKLIERITQAYRSSTDAALLEPHGPTPTGALVFRLRPREATPAGFRYRVVVVDDIDLSAMATIVQDGAETAADGVLSVVLTRANAPAGLGPGAYSWFVEVESKQDATAPSVRYRSASFRIVEPSAIAAAVVPTGSADADRLLRAFALLQAGLPREAKAELGEGAGSTTEELMARQAMTTWVDSVHRARNER